MSFILPSRGGFFVSGVEMNRRKRGVMKITDNTIGSAIHEFRTAHGLTMQQFADLAGLSKGYISMLEHNRNPRNGLPITPSIETCMKVAQAMNIPPEKLLGMIKDASVGISAFDARKMAMRVSKKSVHPEEPARTGIQLPQATLQYTGRLPSIDRLLVLDGRPPEAEWLHAMVNLLAPQHDIYAVDHGVDACHTAGVAPSVLLGDADSATLDSWRWGTDHAISIEKYQREKDLTDTQLALVRATKGEPATLIITGTFGGRFDHAYSTIFSAAQLKSIPCILADEHELIVYVHAGRQMTLVCERRPKAISLLPMTAEARGVTFTGTHWELHDATLYQKQSNAVSNELEAGGNRCMLQIRTGCVALYACW